MSPIPGQVQGGLIRQRLLAGGSTLLASLFLPALPALASPLAADTSIIDSGRLVVLSALASGAVAL